MGWVIVLDSELAATEDWVRGENLDTDTTEALADLPRLLADYSAAEGADRASLGQRLTTRFFTLYAGAGARACAEGPDARDLRLLRCAAPVAGLLGDEMASVVDSLCADPGPVGPVYYVDEWLMAVFRQEVAPSTTDEVSTMSARPSQSVSAQLARAESEVASLKPQAVQALKSSGSADDALLECAQRIVALGQDLRKLLAEGAEGQMPSAAPLQRERARIAQELRSQIENLSGNDRGTVEVCSKYAEAVSLRRRLQARMAVDGAEGVADSSALGTELATIRQMMKMAIGPRGNHFPIASPAFVRTTLAEGVNSRASVIEKIQQVEAIEPGLFRRVSFGQEIRIEPLVLLLPCSGSHGICWEAWQKGNRRTPGRIAVPLYCGRPQNDLVVRALGAHRWLVAQETAMHYWMEEGLTGAYYQFRGKSAGSRIDEAFAQDYVSWITREAQGRPVLDAKLRALFWHHLPFSPEVKARLKGIGAYRSLLEADARKAAAAAV